MAQARHVSLARRVTAVLRRCLIQHLEADNRDVLADALIVEGLTSKFAFNKQRLAKHRAVIAGLCEELQATNQPEGISFSQLGRTRNGKPWGERLETEYLLALALATGQATIFPAQRSDWATCPGGLPYVWLTPSPTVH